jgi:hypothetical protein
MNSQFESAWWRTSVPEGWKANEDNVCVTFTSRRLPGALQVSAAIKEAAPVTDADLREFAHERIANKQVKAVETTYFDGIHIEFVDNDRFWREWWLKSGNLLLYVTYNVEKELRDLTRSDIDAFIGCLEPRPK